MNNPLNRRQKQVLTAIVDHYIVKAEPVSSKVLSVNPILQASSATIRNTMVELEQMGFVEQPHSSAGRTPTDRGYRTYIDELMPVETLTPNECEAIEAEIAEARDEQEVLSVTAKMLERLTKQLGVAVAPSLSQSKFQNLSLIPIAENRVMIILSVADTVFRTTWVDPGIETSIFRLESIARRITEQMYGKPVSLLNALLKNPMETLNSEDERPALQLFERSISKLFQGEKSEDISISGTKNIVGQQNFETIEEMDSILDLLDSKMALVHFLRQRNSNDGVHVTIGTENRDGYPLRSVSIVTSAFTMGGAQGIVGVMGPKRMPYSRLIAIVDHTAKVLSRDHGPDTGH